MNRLITFFLSFSVLSVTFIIQDRASAAADSNSNGVYIVYMGAATSSNGSLKNEHALLLNSVLSQKKNAVVRIYKHGIAGFAARLTAEEAKLIAQKPGVVSVFPDRALQLHTTRSWEFLKYQTDLVIDSTPTSDSTNGSDSIIGIIDTGIWPESESFNDKDMGPIPSRWKGTCVQAHSFNSTNCNRKLIGARFYKSPDFDDDDYLTPRDSVGHGTHVASTAAGALVSDASFFGLASGTAKGGSPGSRIAMYRVCTPICYSSNILAAYDDAIADGVDILSLSLGSSPFLKLDFKEDSIALGAFHAVENGITVVCSAGNDGPDRASVVNGAPWIFTVAASTIDRDFESDVVFGGNKVIKGGAINFANLSKSPVNPLIYGLAAKKANAEDRDARNCGYDSLDEKLVKGKIVICSSDSDDYSAGGKRANVEGLGGIGVILIDDKLRTMASNYEDFPMTVITSKDADEILLYVNSTKNPVATILPTVSVSNYKPAPAIAYFSSRGPFGLTSNILKPDIAAPGVNILAAWIADDTDIAPNGKQPPLFNVISGTSMSCPHVSGIAGVVKSHYPTWSPSAVRSAIMTTASPKNNMKSPITTEKGQAAGPYDYGAGEISPTGPLQPGLVYETTTIDYLNYLCYYGYNTSKIKEVSKTVPSDFACPKDSSIDLISNINYPSIAISNLKSNEVRNVSRTVKNVGGDGETTYNVIVEAPTGISVKVVPDKLQFKKNGDTQSYHVIFSTTTTLKDDLFGSITWTNSKYKVRSPFVVTRMEGSQ